MVPQDGKKYKEGKKLNRKVGYYCNFLAECVGVLLHNLTKIIA